MNFLESQTVGALLCNVPQFYVSSIFYQCEAMDEDEEEKTGKAKDMTFLPHKAYWYITLRAAEIF